ncbi:hypothetical protein CQW23_19917 [Capsicum baccatum]|uniref:Uncharacterized protein n=1 Tax=Capsicum baccatum TaxID=33114 RepID=A0A2G2W744_CAPBA|nr:putative ankyrin repeat and KH domain-containing protein 1-like [Capsicum annuum]PHT41063.1 hypothetical protein CQW23_19917 [Capsicum baccatum]
MRIRKPIPNSPSSSSSSSSSSSLFTFSSLTDNSLASSIDSSSSTSSSTSSSITHRCQGLDLLVKAIHQVTDGSIVGVPYIQKRVITRRRRRVLSFESFFLKDGLLNKRQQRKRLKTVPTKYQDSELIQSLKMKPKSRRLQRSVKICEES